MAERVKLVENDPGIRPKKVAATDEAHYQRGPYKSAATQGRVLAKRLLGQSKRKIAESEGIHRETVARILSMEDMKNAILDARKKFVGLLPLAIEVYCTALEKREGKAAMDAARHVIDGSQTAVPKTESLIEMTGAEDGRSTEDQFFHALHSHWPEEPCHCGEAKKDQREPEKAKGAKV